MKSSALVCLSKKQENAAVEKAGVPYGISPGTAPPLSVLRCCGSDLWDKGPPDPEARRGDEGVSYEFEINGGVVR